MMALEKVGIGQRFHPKAETWNAFIDAARYVQDKRLSEGSEGRRDERPWGCAAGQNDCAFDAPGFGLAEIHVGLFPGDGDPSVRFRRPSQSGFARIGILTGPVPAGEMGQVRHAGITPVLYDDTFTPAYRSVKPGGRLGCRQDSWCAQYDEGGPLAVLQLLRDPDEDGVGLALARVTGLRLQTLYANDGRHMTGPFYTLVLGDGIRIVEEQPGVGRSEADS
jgi:hypothetical protein